MFMVWLRNVCFGCIMCRRDRNCSLEEYTQFYFFGMNILTAIKIQLFTLKSRIANLAKCYSGGAKLYPGTKKKPLKK